VVGGVSVVAVGVAGGVGDSGGSVLMVLLPAR
jgi:hypothetical protein